MLIGRFQPFKSKISWGRLRKRMMLWCFMRPLLLLKKEEQLSMVVLRHQLTLRSLMPMSSSQAPRKNLHPCKSMNKWCNHLSRTTTKTLTVKERQSIWSEEPTRRCSTKIQTGSTAKVSAAPPPSGLQLIPRISKEWVTTISLAKTVSMLRGLMNRHLPMNLKLRKIQNQVSHSQAKLNGSWWKGNKAVKTSAKWGGVWETKKSTRF